MILMSQPEGVWLYRALTPNCYIRALVVVGSIDQHKGWAGPRTFNVGGNCVLKFVSGQLLGTVVIPDEEEHGIPAWNLSCCCLECINPCCLSWCHLSVIHYQLD